jgi:four helix bundle protein
MNSRYYLKMSNQKPRKYDLEDRLVRFSAATANLIDQLNESLESRNLKKQLIRSSSSPALNYGESLAAESRPDFIHKLSICLKELIETRVALKLIEARSLCQEPQLLQTINKECSELIGIFFKSIETAKKNSK